MENSLMGAFLHDATQDKIIVRAEDIENEGSGIDYSLSFFEPKPGKSYKVKLITNPFGSPIVHRTMYKNLPDPTRKNKSFRYVSNGSPKSCEVLQLFFEQHELKKNGDMLATHKIKKFLGSTDQAATLVQILSSEDTEEIGLYRILAFSNRGENAHLSILIDSKMNPSEADMKEGIVKEDLHNIFGSSVLMITCEEKDFDGTPGRSFAKSKFLPNKDSAYIKYINKDNVEITHKFSEADKIEGGLTPQALEALTALGEELSKESLSMHNMFEFKVVGDPKNTESTEKYLKDVNEKVQKIIPIIRDAKTISECMALGEPSETQKADGLKGNIPTESANELNNSALNQQPTQPTQPNTQAPTPTAEPMNDDVMAILQATNGQQ